MREGQISKFALSCCIVTNPKLKNVCLEVHFHLIEQVTPVTDVFSCMFWSFCRWRDMISAAKRATSPAKALAVEVVNHRDVVEKEDVPKYFVYRRSLNEQ